MPIEYYTNFSDLLKGLSNDLATTLNTKVSKEIKKRISISAKKNVIKETSGRGSGGIDDMNQMKSRVEQSGNFLTLVITDTAKPSPSVFGQKFDTAKDSAVGGTMFANWIEHGQWVDLKQLLQYRMGGEWAWNPREESWSSKYDPQLAMSEARYGAMTKAKRDFKPRREPRPFMEPVQIELNSKPEIIMSILEKVYIKNSK